jgi:enoyl-CoA hydratase/carnithine racemase
MAYQNIRTETIDSQFRITLDREGKPNPINDLTVEELDAALDEFEETDAARVLTITGSERAFATGADIGYLNDWVSNGQYDGMLKFVRDGQVVMNRLDELRAPTIAAVDGYALGGGMELALACDFRFATTEATLGLPEIDLGMIPGWGGTQRLPALVGEATAKDLLLTGRHLDAQEALDIGLVDRVVEREALFTTLDDYVAALAEKPPETMGYMLDSVLAARRNPLEGGLTYELMCDMLASTTDETRDRIEAFLEKRA